jgi:hypothetical protein
MRQHGIAALVAALLLTASTALPAAAQPADDCRFVCQLEWKVEPTFTIENLANRPRIVDRQGTTRRVDRERVFETVLALDLATRLPLLGFTVEAAVSPLSDDNSVQLEFESNFNLLREEQTGGWVSSHVDLVDQFSPAERPGTDRAYTHKLDLEWDTAFHLFTWLPEGRWLRGVEFESSLDYLATGTPRKGDLLPDGTRFLDDASRWSLSLVIVLPVAPF